MPHYIFNNRQFYFHPVQNVILISSQTPMSAELVTPIIQEIVQNKEVYNIQDSNLPFDAFIRHGQHLFQYSFNENGELVTNQPQRDLNQEGLFHFQFQTTNTYIEKFEIEHNEFYVDQIINPNLHDIQKDELSDFIKLNFPEHFELWELQDEQTNSETVRSHTALLAAAANKLYTVRDKNNQLTAVVGISMTADEQLAFQTITITREDIREKGIMAAVLQRISNDYPSTLLTAYVVNPKIRSSLGETAMTKPNEINTIPVEKSTFLQMVTTQRNINLSQSPKPSVY